MRPAAADGEDEVVLAHHDRPLAGHEMAGFQPRRRVEREDRLWSDFVEDAVLEHQLGAAALSRKSGLFGRLEEEHHGARDVSSSLDEHLGGPHENRRMGVVSAGVHHSDVLASIEGTRLRSEGKAGLLGDGKGVHVGAERHDRTRLRSFQ